LSVGDLVNTLDSPSEFDALTSLRPGEPYFVLVGRDRLAPPRIYDWADHNRRRALRDFDEGRIGKEERDRELRKSTQAEMIAEAMVEFKNGHVAQAPPKETISTYSGHQLPAETKRTDAIQSARVRASAAIHSAIAEIVALDELLGEEWADLLLAEEVANLRDLAAAVEPKRPAFRPVPLLEAVETQREGES
jgi:hypothetical protein